VTGTHVLTESVKKVIVETTASNTERDPKNGHTIRGVRIILALQNIVTCAYYRRMGLPVSMEFLVKLFSKRASFSLVKIEGV
jgi:hypothetical protein